MSGVEVVGRLAGSVQGVEEGEMEGERERVRYGIDPTLIYAIVV